jgi:hypothetical protein
MFKTLSCEIRKQPPDETSQTTRWRPDAVYNAARLRSHASAIARWSHNFRRRNIMKRTQALNFVKFAACMVLVTGFSTGALASCGDSLSAMAAQAALIHSQSSLTQQGSASSGDHAVNSSIVGLWHVEFIVGGQTIQEAYQLWNVGGTEVHNPNVDPRAGSVCLGVWKKAAPQTYKLTHRVWWYDTNGNALGTVHLSETLTLGNRGNTHSGSFTLDFFDTSNTFQFEVAGSVTGERISVE